MRRPLDVPLADSAAPAETTGPPGQGRDGTCQDETSGAYASGLRCSTFPRKKPRCCAIARCPTTSMSWCSTSTVACPRCGSRIYCWRWTPLLVSPTLSPICARERRAETASDCPTSSWPRASIRVSARWPRPPTPMTSSSPHASRAGISKARRSTRPWPWCLAMVSEAQAQLPMSGLWGQGFTASSDGQFFPAARQGEAMNLVNARYGSEPGLKAYTHVSDQFGPFATQTIPAMVHRHGQRSPLYPRQVADDQGWTARPRAIR